MALYVDCASLDEIVSVGNTVPLLAGVTTNPSIMLAACERGQRLDPLQLLSALLDKQPGLVFIQPGAISENEMLQEARSYIELWPDRVIPKIPMTQVGVRVARALKVEGQRVAFTAVTSVAQAYCAALMQADYLIPYYNRLARSGVNASERIAQIAQILQRQQLPSRILVASIKSSAEAAEALIAGAHDLTVAPQVLLAMVTEPESERAVEKFTQDWRKMKIL
jgi:TalC/MipB family fructose-6-phosphate aldolase